ncbi:MAG: hypothetical protein HOV87_29270 [Catenulispora sp.]|nr:hypothetical protein [Catenulispora sp.]
MRKLLSSAFPPPEDEPHQRDLVDAAMEWGERRRRRDWALAGAAALAVVAVGAGTAVMSGGGSGPATAGGGNPTSARDSASPKMPPWPAGTAGTEHCSANAAPESEDEFCRLFNERQQFGTTFANASVPYIRAALPAGFSVRPTSWGVLILTGPNGKTNLLFASVTGADTLDGHAPSCGPAAPSCVQTSTAGGSVLVNGAPSDGQSAGYVKAGMKDPRITINIGTATSGEVYGVPAPTSNVPLLSNEQLAKVVGNAAYVQFATQQDEHWQDLGRQLRKLSPPSPSGAPPGSGSGSWTPPSGTPSASGSASWTPPSSAPSATGSASWTQSSGMTSAPSATGSGSWTPPSSAPSMTDSSLPPESSGSHSGGS